MPVHATRRGTAAVGEVLKAVRKRLPRPPPARRLTLGGRPRRVVPPTEAPDHAVERWRWREATRTAGGARVHALRRRGLSLRAIAQQTGFNRRTVRAWVRREAPAPSAAAPAARPVGSRAADPPPPVPWAGWDEVRRVRAQGKRSRSLILRRPEHRTAGEQAQLQDLLDGSPAGRELRVARAFLVAWYGMRREETGQRRSPEEARSRYERWRADAAYARLAPLRRVQQSVDPGRFERLSCFLHHPSWEATSNGAERMGRTFRHR